MSLTHKSHWQHIDVLKGVAIFLVVVGHAFHFGFAYYGSPLFLVLRSIDMPIFVFLSGYLAAAGTLRFDAAGYGAFWRKKARQLFLPLLTLPTIYAIFYSIPAEEMLWGVHHGGYWFTWVLFEMFVLWFVFRLLNHYTNPNHSSMLEVLWALLTLSFVLWIDHPWQSISPQTYGAFSWGKMHYLYHQFLLGYFVCRYPRLEAGLIRPEVMALATILFVYLIYTEYTLGSVLGGIPASLSGVVMALGLATHLGKAKTRINSLLAYLGSESRTIYFTHYFLLFSVPMVRPFLFDTINAGGRVFMWEVLSACLYAALVVVATLVVVKLLKANPILAFLCYGKALAKQKPPMTAPHR